MRLQLNKIKDLQDADNRRLIINVAEDCDLGHYILMLNPNVDGESFSSDIKATKWLDNMLVKKGDMVVVYFKEGDLKKKENEDGSATYFLYWPIQDYLKDWQRYTLVLLEASWNGMCLSSYGEDSEESGV